MDEPLTMNARPAAHAVILSSPDREESLRQARLMAAAALCEQGGASPCGRCRHCRKIAAGIHPDVISVRRLTDDKGRQKREIGVDQIRRIAADAVILPNEAARKVYIIEEADTMNAQAQNAALKLLEEPPAGALFFLTASNVELLLPTVRSRCAERTLSGGRSEADERSLQLAEAYLRAAAAGDPARLFAWCAANEGMDSAGAAAFTGCVEQLLGDMLCARRDSLGFSRARLADLAELNSRCEAYLRANVGVKHIFGLMAVHAPARAGNRGREH